MIQHPTDIPATFSTLLEEISRNSKFVRCAKLVRFVSLINGIEGYVREAEANDGEIELVKGRHLNVLVTLCLQRDE